MEFQVQRLRSRGRRLLEVERVPAERGELIIEVQSSNRIGGLPRRVASLVVYESTAQPRRALWAPLFDPRLLSFEFEMLMLGGLELNHDSDTGDIYENYQIWRCVRYAGEPRPLPPGEKKTWSEAMQPRAVWTPPKADLVE